MVTGTPGVVVRIVWLNTTIKGRGSCRQPGTCYGCARHTFLAPPDVQEERFLSGEVSLGYSSPVCLAGSSKPSLHAVQLQIRSCYSSVSFCEGKSFLLVASHVLFTERYRQQEANSWSVLI